MNEFQLEMIVEMQTPVLVKFPEHTCTGVAISFDEKMMVVKVTEGLYDEIIFPLHLIPDGYLPFPGDRITIEAWGPQEFGGLRKSGSTIGISYEGSHGSNIR